MSKGTVYNRKGHRHIITMLNHRLPVLLGQLLLLLTALGLLLDGGDDSPGAVSRSNHILANINKLHVIFPAN